jgi:thiamine-monophosphate kinase
MVRRGTAAAGDVLFLSGTLGDGALGLRLRTGAMPAAAMGLESEAAAALVARYLRPTPRLSLARALLACASAAMDVSDGLVKDCGRLARASGVAAEIEAVCVPFSEPARTAMAARPELRDVMLTGGDDYEILAAVAPERAEAFAAAAAAAGERVTRIGRLVEGAGVSVTAPDGHGLVFTATGWDHFPG